MKATFRHLWRLLRLCVTEPGGRIGLLYCAAVLTLSLGGVYLQLKLIVWNKDFYNALEKHDASNAIWQIGVFVVLTILSSAVFLIGNYLRKVLQIRWRAVLTSVALNRWLGNKAYWRMSTDKATGLDNPDQRIAEDCRIVVERLVGGGDDVMGSKANVLDFFTTLIGLASYVFVLWQVSDFTLQFTVFGIAFAIPHYLVWAAPVYVLICTGMTHWLGAPLMRINVAQQHREADFRFALTRFRESKEAVALENGEAAERKILDSRFDQVVRNWRQLIKRDLILGCFTRPYQSSILTVPLFLAAPAYLLGFLTLGGMMQARSAFQNVVTSLSWFIFNYRKLAELVAACTRLDNFLLQAEAISADAAVPENITTVDNVLRIRDLTISDPAGQSLLTLPDLVVKQGETVWLSGPSGIGKSTLIKTIAGLWPHREGTVELPDGRCLFLPQKAYMPLGNMTMALNYPHAEHDGESAKSLLARVGLVCPRHDAALSDQNRTMDNHGLSGGEMQRLVIARILAAKPDWVFMDEATSALDSEAEKDLLSLLRRALPSTGFIVIAHREPVGLGPLRKVELAGPGYAYA